MDAYGVTVLWVCSFADIRHLLKHVYVQGEGNWDYVWNYTRRRSKA